MRGYVLPPKERQALNRRKKKVFFSIFALARRKIRETLRVIVNKTPLKETAMNALIAIVNDCKDLFGPMAPVITFIVVAIAVVAFI